MRITATNAKLNGSKSGKKGEKMIATVTKKDLSRYALAQNVARLSHCQYKIGAVLYRGKACVSVACNVLKSHPEHKTKYGPYVFSVHAEHRAMLLASTDVRGSLMYVARHGGRGIAKPCRDCEMYMRELDIRAAVYFDGYAIVKELYT